MTSDRDNSATLDILMTAVHNAAEQIDALPAVLRIRALGMLAANYDLRLQQAFSPVGQSVRHPAYGGSRKPRPIGR